MFYANEDISDRLNSIYNEQVTRQSGNFTLPNKEKLLELLKDRKVILFFYLTSEQGSEQEMTDDGHYVPTVNMKLLSFFVSPYGDKLWCDDNSLKYLVQLVHQGQHQPLAMSDELVPQDVCTNIIDKQWENFSAKLDKKQKSFSDFVNRLNK